jgi:hypothetical protein
MGTKIVLKKRLCLYRGGMKSRRFRSLGVAVPEAYGGFRIRSTMLVYYISGATGSFSTAFGAHTGIGTMPITYSTEAPVARKN